MNDINRFRKTSSPTLEELYQKNLREQELKSRNKFSIPVTPNEYMFDTPSNQVINKPQTTEFLPSIESSNGKIQSREESDFFDILSDTLLTSGAIVADVGYGALKGVEGVVDFGATVVGGIGGIFDDDFKDDVGDFIKRDFINETFGEKREYLHNNSLLSDKYTKYGDTISDVLMGVGQMLPAIGAGYFGGPIAQSVVFGASAAGGATEQALNEGATFNQAAAYGLMSGTLETIIEYISGGIGGLGEGFIQKAFPSLTAKLAKNAAANFLVSAVGEGVEEMASEILDPLLKRATYDEDAPSATSEEIIHAGIVGSLCSAVLQGGNVAISSKGTRVASRINTMSEEMVRQYELGNYEQAESLANSINEQADKFVDELKKAGYSADDINNLNTLNRLDKLENKLEKKTNDTELANKIQSLEESLTKRLNTMDSESRNKFIVESNNSYRFDENGNIKASYANATIEQKNVMKKASQAVNTLNNITGKKVKLDFQTLDEENGHYDPQLDTIVIKLNQSTNEQFKDVAIKTTGHEYTHSLKKGKTFNEFVDFMKEVYGEETFESIYNETLNQYSENVKTKEDFMKLSEQEKSDYINEEIACKFIEDNLFTNDKFIRKLVGDNRNLAQKLLDFIKEKISSLGESKEEKYAKKLLNATESKYASMLIESREDINVSDNITKYDIKIDKETNEKYVNIDVNDKFPKDEKGIYYDARNGEKIYFNYNPKGFVKNYILDNLRGKYLNINTNKEISISRQTAKEIPHSKYTDKIKKQNGGIFNAKMLVSTELNNLIETAKWIRSEMPNHHSIDSFEVYSIRFDIKIGDENNSYKGLLKAKSNQGNYTAYDILDINEIKRDAQKQLKSNSTAEASNQNNDGLMTRAPLYDNSVSQDNTTSQEYSMKNFKKYALDDKKVDNNSDIDYNESNKKVTNKNERNEKYGYSDDFRRIQEESRRMSNEEPWYRGFKTFDENIRGRLQRAFRNEIKSRRSQSSNNYGLLENTGDFKIYKNIDPQLFHDIFEISRMYLENGELVDLHNVETTEEAIGYNDCTCYLNEDGLSGFAITNDGDLISVYNVDSERRGFLRSISQFIKQDVKTLDCYVSYVQNLKKIYEKKFGFKTASIMDFNYDILAEEKGKEYADYFVKTHGKAPVAFMVNTNEDVKTKYFNEDQYSEAQEYQQSFVNKITKYSLGDNNSIIPPTGNITNYEFDDNKSIKLKVGVGDKVKSVNTKENKSFKTKFDDYKLDFQIKMTNSQAGIEKTLVNLGKTKENAEVSTNYARASNNRVNRIIEDGFYNNATGEFVTKSWNDIFVNSVPSNLTLGSEEREAYLTDRNEYLLHWHNIDRTNVDKPVFGKYLDFNKLTKDQKSFIKEYAPEIYALAKEKVISEFDLENLYKTIVEKKKPTTNNTKKITENIDVDSGVYDVDEYDGYIPRKNIISEINSYLDSYSVENSKQRIRELEKAHPEFKDFSEDVWKLSETLLDKRLEYGLITQKEYKLLKKTYPHYVPTFRVQLENGKSNSNRGIVSKTLKKAKGGDSVIQPLDISFAREIHDIERAGAMNTLLNDISNAYDITDEAIRDEYISIQKASDVESDDQNKKIRHTILDDTSLENDYGLLEDINEFVKDDKNNTYKATFYKNGKKYYAYMNKSTYEGFEVLNGNSKRVLPDIIDKPVRKANSVFKNLVTNYNPFFTVRNVARDVQDALLHSKHGYGKILKNLPKAYKEILNNGKYWLEAKANGLLYSSIYDYNYGSTENNPNGKKSNKAVRRISQALERVNLITEQATRLSEYMLSRESGKTIEQSILDAQDVTVNFGRNGTLVKELNSTLTPFLNAQVQGFCKMYKTAVSVHTMENFARLLGRVAFFGILPTLINKLMYNDDDDYNDLPQYYKDNFYLLKVGKNFIKIPKGRVLSIFSSGVDRTINYSKGDENAYKGYGDTISQAMSPVNDFRTIFSPIKDVKTNTTWYGGNIESSKYSKVKPSDRYNQNTSIFGKAIGKAINVSPLKVDYLLDQYTGIVGDILIPATSSNVKTNMLTFVTSNIVVDPIEKNKYSSYFNDKLTKLTYEKNNGNIKVTLQLKYLNKIKERINELYNQEEIIKNDSSLSNQEKKEKLKLNQILINSTYKTSVTNVDKLGQNIDKLSLSTESINDDYIMALYYTFDAKTAISLTSKKIYQNSLDYNFSNYDLILETYLNTKGKGRKYSFDYIENLKIPKSDKQLLFQTLGYKLKQI